MQIISQIKVLNERISVLVLFSAFLFLLLTVISFFALYMPAKEQASLLQEGIDQEQRTHEMLLRLPVSTPLDSSVLRDIEQYRLLFPQVTDFPLVVAWINDFIKTGFLEGFLEYTPLRVDQDYFTSNLKLRFHGEYEQFLLFVNTLEQNLPNLAITYVSLEVDEERRLAGLVEMTLSVLPNSKQSKQAWQARKNVDLTDLVVVDNFGYPFYMIEDFYSNSIKVLGVVTEERTARVLISNGSQQNWMQIGDTLRGGTISEISGQGVSVQFGGIIIMLRIGG